MVPDEVLIAQAKIWGGSPPPLKPIIDLIDGLKDDLKIRRALLVKNPPPGEAETILGGLVARINLDYRFAADHLRLIRQRRALPGEDWWLAQFKSINARWSMEVNEEEISIVVENVSLKDPGNGIIVELGSFRVHIQRLEMGIASEEGIWFEALNMPGTATGVEAAHPHISDRHMCFGTAARTVQEAMQDGRLVEVFEQAHDALFSYNPQSPYWPLWEWYEERAECAGCGNTVSADASGTCDDCDETFCEECLNYCEDCERSFCEGCHSYNHCHCCEAVHCLASGLIPSAGCGHLACEDCRRVCEECETEVCIQCTASVLVEDEEGDCERKRLCRSCAEGHSPCRSMPPECVVPWRAHDVEGLAGDPMPTGRYTGGVYEYRDSEGSFWALPAEAQDQPRNVAETDDNPGSGGSGGADVRNSAEPESSIVPDGVLDTGTNVQPGVG